MPNGRTHDIITFVTTPIVAGICYSITKDIKTISIITTSYLFASFIFNGDLDTNSSPYNRWWLLKMIWIPYQLMFHHRSVFTHGILIGTVVRLLYLGIIPLVIYLTIYNGNMNNIVHFLFSSIFIHIFVGLELGNIIHTLADKTF
jgi:uncharacterized metal-binding protein